MILVFLSLGHLAKWVAPKSTSFPENNTISFLLVDNISLCIFFTTFSLLIHLLVGTYWVCVWPIINKP